MLCCVLAGLLAFAGVKGRRQSSGTDARHCDATAGGGWLATMRSNFRASAQRPGRVAAFGACCGVLGFQVVAVLCTWSGGLVTRRPQLLLVGTIVFTLLGTFFALGGGAPKGRRAWALFALSASAGSALVELADLHLLKIHTKEDVIATIALHGLAVVGGLVGGQLLLSGGDREQFAPARLRSLSSRG
jgi:hypothetical protein